MPPEAAVGAAFPPAEIAAFSDENGAGSVQFEVRSDVENESLGCNHKVACTIEVIPINGLCSCDRAVAPPPTACRPTPPAARAASSLPGSSNFANQGVDQAVVAGAVVVGLQLGQPVHRSRSPSGCRRTPATSSTRGRPPASTARS